MRTHHAAWLNGQALQDIDDSVYIVDIVVAAPRIEIDIEPRTNVDGARVISNYRRQFEIQIHFLIRHRDPAVRQRVLDDVLDWAVDGELAVNSRPDRYANVMVTECPSIDSDADWTRTLVMEFTCYEGYWLSDDPQIASLSYAHDPEPATISTAAAKTFTLTPPGTADTCCLEFEITNDDTTDDMDDIIMTTGGRTFTFAALGLGHGEKLVCAYDENGFISFNINGASVMAKRTGDDDLILTQRVLNTVSIKTIKPATVVLKARGRWK